MADLVQSQIDGDPLVFVEREGRSSFEKDLSHMINCYSMEKNTPDFLLAKFMEKSRQLFVEISDERDRWRNENPAISNFGFYVDGFTLNGTDTIGEVSVTAMDGRTCIIKSSSLVAFLERRLEPNVFPEDQPKG